MSDETVEASAKELEEIAVYGRTGMSAKDVSIVLGRPLTDAEKDAHKRGRTAWRLDRAKVAQAKAAAARKAEKEAEKGVVAKYLAGTMSIEESIRQRAPKSDLERQHARRERGRELSRIRRVRHRRVRAKCGLSLLEFGLKYCMTEFNDDGTVRVKRFLDRRPSPRMLRFVTILEETIRKGGNQHVRWPRGKGKSTWVKIAALWSIVYGYRRFVVIVAATKPMAKEAADEIWKYCSEDERFAKDFPEIAQPLADVSMTPQRARIQTYNGKKTHVCENLAFHYKRFALLDGFANTGGIIAYRGADQAIRGLNINSMRPDFVFVDDPQTDESARSTGRGGQVEKIEERIQKALLALGDTSKTISAVMASTPIEPDDVSERFADPERHPEWVTTTEVFVTSWGPAKWMEQYFAKCAEDNLQRDTNMTGSRAFYSRYRHEIEAGAEMMDDSDFDPKLEVSAYHHALRVRFMIGDAAFRSEYQMQPSRAQGVYKITTADVAKRVNGVPYGVVPAACDRGIVAFCDVNGEQGLRWGIMAFGKGRVSALLACGKYPEHGRLFPEGIPSSAVQGYLGPAMREVVNAIKSVAFVRETDGEPETVRGICFDGGWETETVAAVCAEMDGADGVAVAWSKGYGAREYSLYHHERAADPKEKRLRAAEMCHTWATSNGYYLAMNSDYWREVSQTSFLAQPLAPSSCSFWGSSASVHYDYAAEVCAEQLMVKESHPKYGYIYSWKKTGHNHFGDVNYGCMAYASIRGILEAPKSLATDEHAAAASALRKKRRKVVYEYS